VERGGIVLRIAIVCRSHPWRPLMLKNAAPGAFIVAFGGPFDPVTRRYRDDVVLAAGPT
jgi:hypothetical protein